MINFGALVPHPPLIIPEIGKERIEKVNKTIEALKQLGDKLADKDPQTIVFITPHGPLHPTKINIAGTKRLKGDLKEFGVSSEFEFENNLKLAQEINKKAEEEGIPTTLYRPTKEQADIDHGILAPAYYLLDKLGSVKILPVTYSHLNRTQHFAFGQLINRITKEKNQNIAIIASGDLSHRLHRNAPGGYSEIGPEFDQMILDYLKESDTSSLLKIEPEIVQQAGECGYRSLLVLLGALEEKDWQAEVLSYEGPFGVGYGVVDFKLREKQEKEKKQKVKEKIEKTKIEKEE